MKNIVKKSCSMRIRVRHEMLFVCWNETEELHSPENIRKNFYTHFPILWTMGLLFVQWKRFMTWVGWDGGWNGWIALGRLAKQNFINGEKVFFRMFHSSKWRKHEKLQLTEKCGRFYALYSVRVCFREGKDEGMLI